MKFAGVIFVFISLFGTSLALRHAHCGQPPAMSGSGEIMCAAFIPSWSYFRNRNECREFIYGGCGGNDNRFGSKQSCEQKCKK